MNKRYGGMLSFQVVGGRDAAVKMAAGRRKKKKIEHNNPPFNVCSMESNVMSRPSGLAGSRSEKSASCQDVWRLFTITQ